MISNYIKKLKCIAQFVYINMYAKARAYFNKKKLYF